MASFLSPLRAHSWCQYTEGSGVNRILASPYFSGTDGENTGFPLKKVLRYFLFSLGLNVRMLKHSWESALAFLGP